MRFQQYITELKIEKGLKSNVFSGSLEYFKKINDIHISVEIHLDHMDTDAWSIGFKVRSLYWDENDKRHSAKITQKDTMNILSFVVSAIIDFIEKKKPEIITFSEHTGMKGGLPLYKRFTKEIIKRYPYKVDKLTGSKHEIFVLRRTK